MAKPQPKQPVKAPSPPPPPSPPPLPEPVEKPTPEMIDIMKTQQNERAYKRYEERKRRGEESFKCGGSVKAKKMAKGGSVCRGGGAATKGTQFKGVC